MVFPVSGVEVNPLIPPLIALLVSTFTSMGGVSGAFLLLPVPGEHPQLHQPGGKSGHSGEPLPCQLPRIILTYPCIGARHANAKKDFSRFF